MGTNEEKPGFTVTDRRSFTEETSRGGESSRTAAEARPSNQPPAAGGAPGTRAAAADSAMPPVEFATFVLSLGSSALLHLGELESPPGGEEPKIDLGLAKHTIDVLAMLQAKTKGNLTAAEAALVENLLFDLQLRFVETSQAAMNKRG